MAAIRKTGNRYQLDFTLFGHRIRTNFHAESYAEEFKNRLLAALPVHHQTIDEAIATYLKNETDKRKIKQSRIMERYWFHELRIFLRVQCGLEPVEFVNTVTRFHLEKFQSYLKVNGSGRGRKLKNSSVNRRFNSIKNLFRKLEDWGFIKESPAAKIRNLPETLSRRVNWKPKELETVLSATPNGSFERDIILLLNHSGMRLGSALDLKGRDVDRESRTIVVRQRKGRSGEERSYMIPLAGALDELVARRLSADPEDFLFRGVGETRVNLHMISKRCSRLFAELGLPHLTLHGLRHSLASRLHAAGASIETIRQLLGHSSIRTTQIYLHTEFEHLRRWLD